MSWQDNLSSGKERTQIERGLNTECHRNVYFSNYGVLDMMCLGLSSAPKQLGASSLEAFAAAEFSEIFSGRQPPQYVKIFRRIGN
jgi:hypothetical protein